MYSCTSPSGSSATASGASARATLRANGSAAVAASAPAPRFTCALGWIVLSSVHWDGQSCQITPPPR